MSQKEISRRDLLKLIAAATGAVAISSVPNKWVTPIVQIGALPAHAQGSAAGSIFVRWGVPAKPAGSNAPKTGALTVNIAALSNLSLILYTHDFATSGTWTFTSVPPGAYRASWTTLDCTNPISPQDITVVANLQATLTINAVSCNPG